MTRLNVEGMTCTNCALTVSKVLEKDGLKNVNVSFVTGEVSFDEATTGELDKAVKDINRLGYRVVNELEHQHEHSEDDHHGHAHAHAASSTSFSIEKKFYISLLFTVPVFLHMILPFHFLHLPFVQLILCLPVMAIGVLHFGRSAWLSVKSGVPNMDVLIIIGSGAAFIYSLAGMLMYPGPEVNQYLFFETAATIITLVLLGNVIEHRSVKQTTTAISELSRLQASVAKKIIHSGNGNEETAEVKISEIRKGDFLRVNMGDKIPVDGKIISGGGPVNEAMITGESMPVHKMEGDEVTGSTILESGTLKMIAEKIGNETTLAKIIEMVKTAQNSKPKIQKLGDKVSAVFVPAVLVIALLTFVFSWIGFHLSFSKSLMSSIAVLVISCPCAMGLATPTAVMVGIGRAARNGILIKGGSTLESFAGIKTVVFDKTGTLTTGNFRIRNIHVMQTDEPTVRAILYSMELHSSHPLARSIVNECRLEAGKNETIRWKKIEEDKGVGINATDENGILYSIGSFRMVKHFYNGPSHTVFLLKNNELMAAVDMEDEVKKDAKQVIEELKRQNIKTVMVSGDRNEICEAVARQLGIDNVFSEQLPAQKLALLERFSKEAPTAMVGDGINDAPALAMATVGVSLSNASQVAIQSAQVVLLHGNDLSFLLKAIQVSKHTLLTIRQNLFWAFFYNVIAIPIAAAGMLSPMIGALSMAFSDVIVIGNSIRLKTKKIF